MQPDENNRIAENEERVAGECAQHLLRIKVGGAHELGNRARWRAWLHLDAGVREERVQQKDYQADECQQGRRCRGAHGGFGAHQGYCPGQPVAWIIMWNSLHATRAAR